MKLTRLQFLGSLIGAGTTAPVVAKAATTPFIPAGSHVTIKPIWKTSGYIQVTGTMPMTIDKLQLSNATLVKAFQSQTYVKDKLDAQSIPLFDEVDA